MAYRMDRSSYALTYGPTTGDRLRLADTNLIIGSSAILACRARRRNSAAVNRSVTAWRNLQRARAEARRHASSQCRHSRPLGHRQSRRQR